MPESEPDEEDDSPRTKAEDFKKNIETVKSTLNSNIDLNKAFIEMSNNGAPFVEFKSDVDEDYLLDFLTKPFDLYDSLSRFLIVEKGESFVLYAVFHHIIFDALSSDVFKRDLYSILDGGIVGVDDSFLRTSAFNLQISETCTSREKRKKRLDK